MIELERIDYEHISLWYIKHTCLLHREDGPAVIFKDDRVKYYLNDIEYPNIKSNEEWLIKQIIE